MKLWSHDRYRFPLPDHHRFPIDKYTLLRAEMEAQGHEVLEAAPVPWELVEPVQDPGLVARIRDGELTLRDEGAGQRVVVVDCDVHQGDGTAQIFAEDSSTFTVSLHGARNYPFERIPSDLDVDLPSGTGDAEYLRALEDALGRVPGFDAAFYLAGADPWEGDRLGRLALTKDGLRARRARARPLADRRRPRLRRAGRRLRRGSTRDRGHQRRDGRSRGGSRALNPGADAGRSSRGGGLANAQAHRRGRAGPFGRPARMSAAPRRPR